MKQEDVIRMAREARLVEFDDDDFEDGLRFQSCLSGLKRFAALVAAAEREKSVALWMLLDDVDTADDIAKSDDVIYRSLCRQAHKKRWQILSGAEVDDAIRARGNT